MLDEPQSQAATGSGLTRVGVVGLGHMGHAFAANIIQDGYQVLAYDRDANRAAALSGRASRCKVGRSRFPVMLCSHPFPTTTRLPPWRFSAGGLVDVLAPGAVHISTSTVSPACRGVLPRSTRAANRVTSQQRCWETRILCP